MIQHELLEPLVLEEFVALRPFRITEETTMDYGTFWSTNDLTFDCRCGSPSCRGVVKADD